MISTQNTSPENVYDIVEGLCFCVDGLSSCLLMLDNFVTYENTIQTEETKSSGKKKVHLSST